MREINQAFFLPLAFAAVLALGFLATGLGISTYLVTDMGKFIGESGRGLGSRTL
jgi:hypothetical protein